MLCEHFLFKIQRLKFEGKKAFKELKMADCFFSVVIGLFLH